MLFDYTTMKFVLGAFLAIPFYVAVAFDKPEIFYATVFLAITTTAYLYRHAQPERIINGNVRVGKITVPVMPDIPRNSLGVISLLLCAYVTHMTAFQPTVPLVGSLSVFVVKQLGINANILFQSAANAVLFISGLEIIFEKKM